MLTILKAAKILVVEDNDLLRGQLASLLMEKGCLVESAGTGKEAQHILSAETYDVILLDLMLSAEQAEIQGVDLLHFLQTQAIKTPVIVITNKASNQTILESFEAGAHNVYAFLLKSLITPENLLHLIQSALQFPHLTVDASKYLSGENDFHLIRGIRSDMHYCVRQYVEYFDDYVVKFKGERANVTMFSFLDDIFIQFKSYSNRDNIIRWFEEYLSYPVHYPHLAPVFETSVSATESSVLQSEIQYQVQTFTSEIARNFYWSLRECITIPVQSQDVRIFEINGLKIYNNYVLSAESPSPAFREFRLLESDTQQAVAEGNTMKALDLLLNFCVHHDLSTVKKRTIMLMNRFNRIHEEKRKDAIHLESFEAEISQINDEILTYLPIDIEQELGLRN